MVRGKEVPSYAHHLDYQLLFGNPTWGKNRKSLIKQENKY